MPFKLLGAPLAKKPFRPMSVTSLDVDDAASSWSWLSGVAVRNPPAELRHDFDWACQEWLCFGVEMHDLAPSRHKRGWERGGFGHLRLNADYGKVRALRVVQIGWTSGRLDCVEPPVTKSFLVKPDGFAIADSAAKIHQVTQHDAFHNGAPLDAVLAEFLRDVMLVVNRGGRVCA